jgi:hypothetical protein
MPYNDDERASILAESYEALRRLNSEAPDVPLTEAAEPASPTFEEILARSVEHPNDRARRKLAERNAWWAVERSKRENTQAETRRVLEFKLEVRLSGSLDQHREFVFAAVEEAIKCYDELVVEWVEQLEREVRELRASFDALSAEFRQWTVEGQVLDLSPLPRRGMQ